MKLSENTKYPKLATQADIGTLADTYELSKHKNITCGIEIEVENVPNANTIRIPHTWSIKGDGSLRNNGVEFVSYPLLADQVETAINLAYDSLIPKNAHFSPRTSVHVHLNMRNSTYMDIYKLVLLYQCFEDLIFDFVGSERKKSIFCLPLGQLQYYSYLKPTMLKDRLMLWEKYASVNLKPLSNFGTIEFRHMRGTANKADVLDWITLLFKLYTFAHNISVEELEDLIVHTNERDDYINLGNKVFGDFFTKLASPAWEKKMNADTTIAKLYFVKD